MYYETLLDRLLDEDNDEIIELRPDGGELIKFEQVAVINYEDETYAILHPVAAKEEHQVVVFKLDPDDEDNMSMVEDPKIADAVLEIFHLEIEHYDEREKELENLELNVHEGDDNNEK